METQPIPLKILLPYRTVSVLFGIIALLSFLVCLSFGFRNFFAFALLYGAYAGLNGTLAYGLWKMKKWIVPLLGGAALIVLVINIIHQNISGQMLIGFAVLGTLFALTYFSRNFLDGEYKNPKALGLFLAFLILSQAATFFLK